ncbi:glycosyltransferase family 2 protein [Sphingomonas immobilis]|uniref:Glycosyltransferase family 2 protein n=1 Tax=Sphingomonas immobilis TaxID=3063997 RepID=A0ABT9A1V3_9SPHN|nr:glycosyltransferase family 2 protein [Sphingomonas sp. CA1-15]MDO7843422.1 glycosyltransferase family 2 protein [Sphingomonas sp. CA1-15]
MPRPDALPAELAIVVPTYNEVRNVPLIVAAVERALGDIRWEIVFVDDHSPDGTAEEARTLALADPRVRVLHRYGRRGLASACVEGILATAAPFVAVMDGDMQHDEAVLVAMFRRIIAGDVDLVVGSRYVEGGGVGDWDKRRAAMSRFATALANRLTRTAIGDPMSGFFMLTRSAFMAALPGLSSVGFKILLDIAASSPTPLRVAEVPFTFRARQHGESKLDGLVLWEYLQLLLDKAFGHIIPVRFIGFAIVGGSGVVVHFLVLTLVLQVLLALYGNVQEERWFAIAQGVAALTATSSNFFLNNYLTYRDQRLTGARLAWGWLTFNIVCGVGFLANVGIARWLYQRHNYIAAAALAGIAVTTVWNYAMSSIFTWRKRG